MRPAIDLCAKAALAAYSPTCRGYIRSEAGGTVADVFQGRGGYIVAIRGSDDLGDWAKNLSAWPTRRRGAGVHTGFAQIADALWDRLGPFLRENSAGLTLTGHSMGGAVAQLIAAYLHSAGHTPGAIVTFGAPKVWLRWSGPPKAVWSIITRVEAPHDPVPATPALLYGAVGDLVRTGSGSHSMEDYLKNVGEDDYGTI